MGALLSPARAAAPRRPARRTVLAALAAVTAAPLAGCGFHLRQAPDFAFSSIYIASNSALATELRRNLQASGRVTVLREPAERDTAQVVMDILRDQRERIVLGYNTAGQVREFQLRTRVIFRLRTPDDRELLGPTEILLQQDQSYDESLALAKEAEAQLIYRTMQSDVVQQIMRRLAAIRTL